MRPTHARPLLPTAALALALVAAGCAKEPSAHGCATHADCPSGTTCQQGICQDGLVLELTAPAAATTYANADVPCTVSVTGLVPGAVRLVVDDVAVVTLTPPFSGSLPLSSLSEGSHRLVATADLGGRTYVSPPRTIVVDRIAPAEPAVAPATTGAADPVTVGGTWTTDSGAPVTITVYEGSTVKASGIVPGVGGAWSAGVSLTEGTHQLTATATDAAGNTSAPSSAAAITVDRTPPPTPTIYALTTNAPDPVPVSGTIAADLGTPITVTVSEGATVLKSGVVPSGTSWSTAVQLTEGSHQVTVRSFDAAGNASDQSTATVIVDRTLPARPTVTSARTNQADPVTVSGTWVTNDTGTPVTITVYEGATVLASGVVPVAGAWSAAFALSAATHTITARAFDAAGNQSSLSPAGTIIVDRTAPSVTGRTPGINATGVWSRDNVVVTFSEAIQPGTINGTNVRVSCVSPAFDVAFSSMTLTDPTTLTLVPDATSLPPVPSHVTITLSGLLDLAGNALPTTTWSWDYPDWVDAAPSFRGNYYSVKHAWSASNAGVLYDATPDGPMGIHVSSSTGGAAWASLGQIYAGSNGYQPGVAVDSVGRPVVATIEGGTVVVRRYASGTWTQLGTTSAASTSRPFVGIDSSDRPIVLWKDSSSYALGAYRWSGADWSTQVVGPRTSSSTGAYALVVKRNDATDFAYESSSGMLGATDVALTRNVGEIAGVAIAQGATGDDFIAYVTTPGTVGVVTKLNAYPASSLTDFGPTLTGYATATSWAPGIAYRTVGPSTSRLFLSFRSAAGRPVVYAWDGTSSWVSITGSLAGSAGLAYRDVELYVTPSGQLYLGWWEVQNADWLALFIKRYNR